MPESQRRQSTGFERRESVRESRQLSIMEQEDDEDEYALAAMGMSGGGGGYVPSGVVESQERRVPQEIPTGRRTPPPRPLSTTKPKLDSFALRNDGSTGPIPARNSTAGYPPNAAPTRSSSVSTGITSLRTESTYQGPSGPSHPYQMYPQESRLARTASMATTVTVPSTERSYSGPSGPTHPYGMYPQNIGAEGEHDHLPIAPIPVGFPGLNNEYQRRIGPEGEEAAGIIGPDGHTEELPPYTQYPDEAIARKTGLALQPAILPPLVGAGGIGLATRNPEFESHEDLNTPQSRQSTRSFASDSTHQVNTAALGFSEKPQLKKWQIVARRKLCNVVPIWVVVLIVGVFILFGIILGAVFAALKPKHSQPVKQHHETAPSAQAETTVFTMTTTFDATPFTTLPTGLPTLPTGSFVLPITVPSTIQSGCLLNSEQTSAWSCSIPGFPQLDMEITGLPTSDDLMDNEMALTYSNGTPSVFPYGTLPPTVPQAQVMTLVNDSAYPQKGPAWWFQIPYNKIVVLQEDLLSGDGSMSKRSVSPTAQGFEQRRGVAQPGDYPWFCYWNGTLLEVFVYVNNTSVAGAQMTSSTTTTSSVTATYSSSIPTGAPPGNSGQSDADFLPPYPKVIKVEERRIPNGLNSIDPYCVQHQINSDGSATPYTNSTGQIVTVYLNETDPTTVMPLLRRGQSWPLQQRQDSTTSCSCVWLAT